MDYQLHVTGLTAKKSLWFGDTLGCFRSLQSSWYSASLLAKHWHSL